MPLHPAHRRHALALLLTLTVSALSLSACGAPAVRSSHGPLIAIGAEAQYANVIAQIGGPFVSVSAVMNNPSTDPHSFEVSAALAARVANASLIVQNGLGYDSFMNNLESASPNDHRQVIVARVVRHLGPSAFDPHLWYDPRTMPLVARAIAQALSHLRPAHAAYFASQLRRFDHSLVPWTDAVARFRSRSLHITVAVTEPVADHLLRAMGFTITTPAIFQSDVMNGIDPAPQAIAIEQQLLARHHVAVFCYNVQVVDALTDSLRHVAQAAGTPIVGVNEIMPAGQNYQTWMVTTTEQLAKAVTNAT